MAEKIPYLSTVKFLLILGVVLLHCNLISVLPAELIYCSFACAITDFISSHVTNVCVPCFFFISGLLFFNGVEKFTPSVYLRKLKSRFHTLFIPYMFWCLLCALLLYIKVLYLGKSGLGICFQDGSVDWPNFFRGFWEINNSDNDFPYAFAFWFIRNLMVFCVISPIVYIVARYKWIMIIFILSCIFTNSDCYGFEWFVFGAFYAYHRVPKRLKVNSYAVIICSILFWGIAILRYLGVADNLLNAMMIVKVFVSLYLVYCLAIILSKYKGNRIFGSLVASTFMIYATHQCYCSLVGRAWLKVFGYGSTISELAAYVMTFITLVALGIAAYIILKKLSPKFLNLISGGRIA